MTEADKWNGVLTGLRGDEADEVILTILIERAGNGGSRPAQVLTQSGEKFWIKPLSNPQGHRVPINEQIVARCGQLIQAPTCKVARLRITDELDGYKLDGQVELSVGIAHGSQDIAMAQFSRSLEHRDRDDNPHRHALLFALYDWCWGQDDQWLYDSAADYETFSHDHGHYFPGGPNWTVQSLEQVVGEAKQATHPVAGLDPSSCRTAASRLDEIQQEDLVGVLRTIPASWPVSDSELESLGWFLDSRRAAVSERMQRLADSLN